MEFGRFYFPVGEAAASEEALWEVRVTGERAVIERRGTEVFIARVRLERKGHWVSVEPLPGAIGWTLP